MQRSLKQNSSLHVLFSELANTLNDAGLDQRVVLKPEVSIPWNLESVKTSLWKPIQKAATGKDSTTELDSVEIDKVYDILMRHLGEKFGIFVDFPSNEDLPIAKK